MNDASCVKDGDGKLLFSGNIRSAVPPVAGGGGGGGGGITDMRWSDIEGGIEATADGTTWTLKVPFLEFDA